MRETMMPMTYPDPRKFLPGDHCEEKSVDVDEESPGHHQEDDKDGTADLDELLRPFGTLIDKIYD